MQGCRSRWRPVVSPVIYTLCLSVYYNCTQNCTCTINTLYPWLPPPGTRCTTRASFLHAEGQTPGLRRPNTDATRRPECRRR